MLHYRVDDFISTVLSCSQTISLAALLDMFEVENCDTRTESLCDVPEENRAKRDRVVVLDEEKFPIGLLYSASLMTELLAFVSPNPGSEETSYLQQLLSLDANLLQPIRTVSATESIEEFNQILNSPEKPNNSTVWVVIDANKKYLGLLDSARLLKHLTKSSVSKNNASDDFQKNMNKNTIRNSPQASKLNDARQRKKSNRVTTIAANDVPQGSTPQGTISQSHPEQKPPQYQPLVQLLERLPWPLMLQTSNGEVVTQNPAWWQQLGMLKDPEGVRQEVEAILSPKAFTEKRSPISVSTISSEIGENLPFISSYGSNNDLNSGIQEDTTASNLGGRCFFNDQLGTCTCVVEVQTGQERVWQFAKIPLDSPEWKVINDMWLMLATDVTDVQQLSKELAAKNADLIQLNRLKDEFLACISHELKTPLTAVLGLSRLLVDQQLGELNERQARYAGLIHQSGRHLMSVVNDILDLTRMETGQMELSAGLVKIQSVCDRAIIDAKAVYIQNNKAATNNQNHQFTLTIEPGLDEIVADELRLRQMLVHLLSNAFKFTEDNGKIGLRVSRWEGWVAFTVWDTGIGIAEHQQHLIFQKFQQLENPLTRQFEGTGLGLVLTRALARLHGGDVSFLSREGKGSQFTLLLPPSPPKSAFSENLSHPHTTRRELGSGMFPQAKYGISQTSQSGRIEEEVTATDSTSHHTPNSSQRLILVVEAVGRYIEEITEQLTGLGYRVAIARSGCEAIEKARRLQPKAIFLNPVLPLLSGWDVLTLLKSEEATRRIPAIVTATGAEKEQAFTNRADGFLRLPVQHQMLAPLLDSLCIKPQEKKREKENAEVIVNTPLRILRLVDPDIEDDIQPSLPDHRVIEVDDLEQAELLSRVWQFDVVLLDAEIAQAKSYLKRLSKHPRLSVLPIVTCSLDVSQAASQMSGLSVFPCLTTQGTERKVEALLSVLQIAAGICCPPSALIVDLMMLPDLPEAKSNQLRNSKLRNSRSEKLRDEKTIGKKIEEKFSHSLETPNTSRGSEWFQALIQYLQTGGLKASMARSWAEMLQQIRHHSADLLLICLDGSTPKKEVMVVLKALEKLPFHLPPVLILDQRLNQIESSAKTSEKAIVSPVSPMLGAKVLPRSISMEDLLGEIHLALK
ncbi:MAG: hybrid sensor histidine kinase/response regulator [Methylacidiphilales bacterium]|nr:hybrid sensor histidine kinase/response regulator [Candidatus Methylacidiphilales bacterium]